MAGGRFPDNHPIGPISLMSSGPWEHQRGGEQTMGYVPPEPGRNSFTCPHCLVITQQIWSEAVNVHMISPESGGNIHLSPEHIKMAHCCNQDCHRWSIWDRGQMVYPIASGAPLPNSDLPDDVKADYEEARTIASLSPRGAAALLRLAIQKLCTHLDEPGKNLNDDIASLVKKGLSTQVQQALDVVRVTGNNAVHPGQIDFQDDPERAQVLFTLVNLIAERMITEPKRLEEMFEQLPERDKQAILRRDADANPDPAT
jgi:hypothetical protein